MDTMATKFVRYLFPALAGRSAVELQLEPLIDLKVRSRNAITQVAWA